MQTAIALIQEPWLLNNAIKGLSGCGTIFTPTTQNKIRTCIAIKGLNAVFMPQLSSGDITVIQLRLNLTEGRHRDMLVGSVYMPYDAKDLPPPKEVKELVTHAQRGGLDVLLGCDANSHHVGWGSTDINPRGESLHNFVMETGLTILNRGSEPTFMDCRRQEVIDITLCSRGAAGLVRDWRVSSEPSGSDHRQVHFNLEHTEEAIWGRNPRHTNWMSYRSDLEAILKKAPSRFHTAENLEVAAKYVTDAIRTAFEANCPMKLKNTSAKVSWWSRELSERRLEVRRLFNRAKKTRATTDWDAFRSSQREYTKAINSAKRKSWRKFCEEVESAPEASRLCRILSKNGSSHLGCLKRPDGEYTKTIDESLRHLMSTHFPGFQEDSINSSSRKGSQPRVPYKPREWSLAAKVVYPCGVEWAVKTFDPYKAPGPDGIFPVLLREGLSVLLGPLTRVLRASIALRCIPRAWSGVKVVFIPKPGRNGHILAKDFRPISLTSFILKTLERLVDRFLKNGPLLYRALAPSQYAYREGRSTDTALHHLVSGIETQLEAKGYALGVFIDIEGAFDSTSNKSIQESMTNHEIPEALVDWTQNMLSGRDLIVSLSKETVRGRPAGGCPQGGVLSPLLWCLVVDELLTKLKKAGFLVFGYADDVAIVTRGNFLNTLKERMDTALRIIQNWCIAVGLTVNPSKTAAMIFTRKYKPEPIGPLKLWGKEIAYANSVKYLGVTLDTKLSWKLHLEDKRKKFYTSMWACRRAMGKTWGIKPSIAMWLYKMVLLPRLMYAAVVWWPRMERVEARNLLKSLQGNYLRAATGTMRSTPTEALQTALCLPPLDQAIVCLARQTAYRLKCQGEWRNAGGGHSRLGFLLKHPFTLKQDRIPRRYQLVKTFKVLLPSREDWKKFHLPKDPKVEYWFTDGSGANDRYGAGIYGPKNNHREIIQLGKLASVFQAEVLAIHRCAETLLTRAIADYRLFICTDSRAALDALIKTTTESSVVWDCMLALNKLGETNRLTLVWVPGHQGIHGNETADGLANQGTLTEPATPAVGVPFATGKKIIKDWLDREHLNSWKLASGCNWSKQLMKSPQHSRSCELLAMNKERLRLGVGLLTGHIALRGHLHRLGLAEIKECRLCGEESEDSSHVLCRCPALSCKRYRLWGKMFIEPRDLAEKRVNSLISLVLNTGLEL